MEKGSENPAVLSLVARFMRGEMAPPSRNRNFESVKTEPVRSALRIFRRLRQVEGRLHQAAAPDGAWEFTLFMELPRGKRLDFFRRDGSARQQVRLSDPEWDLLVIQASADPPVRDLIEDAVIDAELRDEELA
jgi:hypothetical protein